MVFHTAAIKFLSYSHSSFLLLLLVLLSLDLCHFFFQSDLGLVISANNMLACAILPPFL